MEFSIGMTDIEFIFLFAIGVVFSALGGVAGSYIGAKLYLRWDNSKRQCNVIF